METVADALQGANDIVAEWISDDAAIRRSLRELLEKGYVASDAQTGYKRRYSLTPLGIQTASRVEDIILTINRFVSGDIPDADIEIFYRTLSVITGNLALAVEKFGNRRFYE